MKALKIILIVLFIVVIGVILTSFFIWVGYPKTKLNLYVLDKTVKNFDYSEHRSLFWILNNARITKTNGDSYSVSDDYYGFCPKKPLSSSQYQLKRITLEQIDSVANAYDALYYTDTYGVYFNEWFRGFRRGGDNSVIEGGLNYNDFLLLKKMKELHKLVISEYSTLEPPTAELIRYKTEELFGIQTTGWVGKYFESLDTTDGDDQLLGLAENYKQNNDGKWPFKKAGVIFTSGNKVVVLENGSQLISKNITIVAKSDVKLKIPGSINYPNWFEVISVADTNEVLATYQLNTNEAGEQVLHDNGLNSNFPAVVYSSGSGSNMYYFAGNFANNPVTTFYSKLANSRKMLHYITKNDKGLFFLNFYFPLMENILKNNANTKKN